MKKHKLAVHFSSEKDDHETPEHVFNKLHREFDFHVDGAASKKNALLPKFWTKKDSAFNHSWVGLRVYINPPYGREINKWIEQAIHSVHHKHHNSRTVVVFLLPARTDTKWFEQCFIHASEIRFITGRLRFGNAEASAPFPSCVIVFDSKKSRLCDIKWVKFNEDK